MAASYEGRGWGGLILLVQVGHDKVEYHLLVDRETHDLGEV